MKYWIIIDSMQKGPLSIEELSAIPGINLTTPVWHEGLPDWTTAASVPEITAMIARQQATPWPGQPYGQQPYNQQPYGQPNSGQQSYNNQQAPQMSYGQWQPGGQPYGGMPYGQPRYPGQSFEPADPNRMPPMPDNYLVWAIITTICCCIPTGIVAIIYASKVSPAYMRGNYNEALDASSKAQMWVIISFVAGLIWAPFSMLLGLL